MSGHAKSSTMEATGHTAALPVHDARILVRHYLEWMPFGGAGEEEIFVLFGVSPARYRQLVKAAVDLIGNQLSPNQLEGVRRTLTTRQRRVA